MGDTSNTGADDQKIEPTENGSGDQDESQNAGGAEGEAEGAGTSEDESTDDGDEAGEGSSDDDASKDGKSEDGKPKPKPTPKPADEEPKLRKRNIDFILERKNQKIAKLQKQAGGAEQEEGDEGTDAEDDIDADDAKVIDKRIQAHLQPLMQKQMEDEDAKEIGDFVKDNPDFAPYADKVKKFAQHPSRKNMPIKALFYEVAGDDLLRIGADRARKATAEARKSQAGGGSGKTVEATKTVKDMSDEEFRAQQEAVRHKRSE